MKLILFLFISIVNISWAAPNISEEYKHLEGCFHDQSIRSSAPESENLTLKRFVGNVEEESDVFLLESYPGAPHVIYLNFTGEPVTSVVKNFSKKSFTEEKIREHWESLAAHFVAFDVNVITNKELYENHNYKNRIEVVFAQFHGVTWDGWAPKGSYGTTAGLLAAKVQYYVRPSAVAHEVGHVLSLEHDGTNSGLSYYPGHGEWAPIMGQVYDDEIKIVQWSKGEYDDALINDNQGGRQDDIEIIASHYGFRPDDNPSGKALIISNGKVLAEENFGIVGAEQDKDDFVFKVEKSTSIDLLIETPTLTGVSTSLDILVKIRDEKNKIVFEENPVGKRSVTVQEQLDEGTYTISVEGGGELDVNTGWSTYGSFGYFEISGTIEGGVTTSNLVQDNQRKLSLSQGTNELNIQTPSSNGDLSIYNSLGKIVYSNKVSNSSLVINEVFPSGKYHIVFSDALNKISVLQFIK